MPNPSHLAQYSRSLGVPVLLISPPKVANQNTPRQKWEAARKMWMAYEECHWFKNQELEPNMPHEAKSVLAQWLNQVDVTVWQCVVPLDTEEAWCHHPHLKRFDRALAHVRSHLGLKPFRCDGKCGMNTCEERFNSSENCGAHRQGKDLRVCEICGAEVLRQNLTRHQAQPKCSELAQSQEA